MSIINYLFLEIGNCKNQMVNNNNTTILNNRVSIMIKPSLSPNNQQSSGNKS